MSSNAIPVVYLARHATPDRTRTDLIYHELPGPPLTPHGERQAAQLGEFLRQAGVRQIYASPLERCRRTAEIAAGIAGAPVESLMELAEYRPEEKDADVQARCWPCCERAFQASQALGPVALVTHGGPIRVLLTQMGLDEKVLIEHMNRFDFRNPLPPAGVWRAARPNPDGPWELSLVFLPEPPPPDPRPAWSGR